MADAAPRIAPQVSAGGWLRTMPPAQRFILQGDARARAAAAPAWGVEFAETPCLAVEANSRATLWLGPDEHLLLGADPQSQAAAIAALEHALNGIPHALVDVSHRQFGIEVSGPHATTILNGACPLDLDLREFPVHMCTRTVLAKAEIVLWRTRTDAFHLEVWRSFGGYVGALLREIALEFSDTR
jgi:sarcosine oxidase, subunit gamma